MRSVVSQTALLPKLPSSVIVVVMEDVNAKLTEVPILIFRFVDVPYVVVEVTWLAFGIVHDRTQHFSPVRRGEKVDVENECPLHR